MNLLGTNGDSAAGPLDLAQRSPLVARQWSSTVAAAAAAEGAIGVAALADRGVALGGFVLSAVVVAVADWMLGSSKMLLLLYSVAFSSTGVESSRVACLAWISADWMA